MSDDFDPIADFDDQLEWTHELHRAIGHFVVRFEWLVDAMRTAIATLVAADLSTASPLILTVLGETTAGAVSTRFQSVLGQLGWFQPEERRMIDNVCVRIQRLTEERNFVVHGMWSADPNLRVVKRMVLVEKMKYKKTGLNATMQLRTPESIHLHADEAEELRKLVSVIESCEHEVLTDWLVWDEERNVRLPLPPVGPSE